MPTTIPTPPGELIGLETVVQLVEAAVSIAALREAQDSWK